MHGPYQESTPRGRSHRESAPIGGSHQDPALRGWGSQESAPEELTTKESVPEGRPNQKSKPERYRPHQDFKPERNRPYQESYLGRVRESISGSGPHQYIFRPQGWARPPHQESNAEGRVASGILNPGCWSTLKNRSIHTWFHTAMLPVRNRLHGAMLICSHAFTHDSAGFVIQGKQILAVTPCQ